MSESDPLGPGRVSGVAWILIVLLAIDVGTIMTLSVFESELGTTWWWQVIHLAWIPLVGGLLGRWALKAPRRPLTTVDGVLQRPHPSMASEYLTAVGVVYGAGLAGFGAALFIGIGPASLPVTLGILIGVLVTVIVLRATVKWQIRRLE